MNIMSKELFGVLIGIGIGLVGIIWAWNHPRRNRYDPDELVTLCEFAQEVDAELWKMRLSSQGVECCIFGSHYKRNFMLNTTGASFILKVRASDIERARNVIKQSTIK